jgi:hypothetical protein
MTGSSERGTPKQRIEIEGEGGTRFRVSGSARLPASEDDGPIVVEQWQPDSQAWLPLPLKVGWRWVLHARGSAWPPERVDAAAWRDGALTVDYESRWDPHARTPGSAWQLDSHAKWRARYDARRRCWQLQRLRLIGEDEPATR